MQLLKNKFVAICLDERLPRVLWYESPDGKTRVPGEREAVAPRLCIFRRKDRAQLTSDDEGVCAEYELRSSGTEATYHAEVTCNGEPAVELDVVIRLRDADATIRFENVREFPGYCFLTIRLQRVVAASSRDADGRVVTCGWQGRLLDPHTCKPNLTDYSWHGTVARPCGAAYRAAFMVTFDLPGYEDLFVQEVRPYTRIDRAETIASLGAEMMYRQRSVEGPDSLLKLLPVPEKNPPVELMETPLLCAKTKEIRLHFIAARRGQSLEWTDAAKYFQSLLPKHWHCDPRYDDTLVYKCVMAGFREPLMTVEEAGAVVRKIHNLTDGRKQVCYFAFFTHEGGDSGHPDMSVFYPPVGDRRRLRKVMEESAKLNAVVSFHDNLDQADVRGAAFDPDLISRNSYGRMFDGGYWTGVQLVQVSMPAALARLKKTVKWLVKEYGIHTTYHLDTHSGDTFRFDANPRRPFNATQFVNARRELAAEFEKYGINLTSECLVEPYLDYLGHVWALFNWGTIWEGEEKVPFANFIYHGVTSWNSGKATDEKMILESLIQGGGSGVEFPQYSRDPIELIDSLYLIQPVYAALRHKKWTACRKLGAGRRVEYASGVRGASGKGSYIVVDDGAAKYEVVVDGQLFAKDFATVFPGPRKGMYLAFSRIDRELDWPAPKGWKSGPVPAVTLTAGGPGVGVPAKVEKGRLRLTLLAHQPVRVGPV